MNAPVFAEVAVHLPVYGLYTYRVPDRLRSGHLVGCLVLVPFGRQSVSGVVVSASQDPPKLVEIREIDALLEPKPLVSAELLQLCLWVARYYEAPPGETLRAALPAGARVSTKQKVAIGDAGRGALAGEGAAISRRDRELLGTVSAAGGTIAQRQLLKARVRVADIARLVEQGLLELCREEARTRVRVKTVRIASVTRDITEEDLDALSRAPKRRAVLQALLDTGGTAEVRELASVPRAAEHLRALAKAGLVAFRQGQARAQAVAVAQSGFSAAKQSPALNQSQCAAVDAITAGLDGGTFHPFLLHGITGSGKTEVYLNAIARVVEAGASAVVLVPEISLTPQLAARFRARFGATVAVLHSGLSDRERHDEWRRLQRGEAQIALGARSAVFAPVANLAIVIVDEEHDSSFKQEEGVRYNARDIALVRAQRNGAVCVLGSATPSLESSVAARDGRYKMLLLPQRATGGSLPAVSVVDLRIYRPDPDGMLTAPLATAIEETLARGEQVILFLNRRGFSTFVICRACGHAFRCDQCSVSLTYHKSIDRLVCHYCGHDESLPRGCPSCRSDDSIVRRGLGTERIADTVAERFPQARVARIDRDVGSGAQIEKILAGVGRGEVDILVGTQMVTKGHDFPGVTLVGVLLADTGLSLPDFRAAERTFQLITQVAGRAGRGDRPGRVIVQTYQSDAIAIAAAAAQDYQQFFSAETVCRQELGYPPFGHLVAIRFDGRDSAAVQACAASVARRAAAIGSASGVTILGPTEAPMARIKGKTRWHMWLRAPERKALRGFVRSLVGTNGGADLAVVGVRITVDVDPISTL